jgi:ATP-dependent Clp protease, protease subunit
MKADNDDDDEDDKDISRENNHIYFYSNINRHTIFKLVKHIREAVEYSVITSLKLSIDEIPIYLHISSNGGLVYPAFAAVDAIKSCPVSIYSIIEGATASAGTIISVACKKRYIRPNAYMLIHQISSSLGGKMHEIEDEFKNLTDISDKMKKLYADNSKLSKKGLSDLLKQDIWLNSEKALEYGLADEIWDKM